MDALEKGTVRTIVTYRKAVGRMTEFFTIDRERTEQLNRDAEPVSCQCPDCRWYCKFMEQLPSPAKAFFEKMGLDPLCCQELWAFFPCDHGWHHYSGFFLVSASKTEEADPYGFTRDWKTLNYGICRFRVRVETASNGKMILGFEADLPEPERASSSKEIKRI